MFRITFGCLALSVLILLSAAGPVLADHHGRDRVVIIKDHGRQSERGWRGDPWDHRRPDHWNHRDCDHHRRPHHHHHHPWWRP